MKIYFKTNKIYILSQESFMQIGLNLCSQIYAMIFMVLKKDLILSLNPKNADILILPLTWNYYFQYGKINEAKET